MNESATTSSITERFPHIPEETCLVDATRLQRPAALWVNPDLLAARGGRQNAGPLTPCGCLARGSQRTKHPDPTERCGVADRLEPGPNERYRRIEAQPSPTATLTREWPETIELGRAG